MGAITRRHQEIQCLPYAGFFLGYFQNNSFLQSRLVENSKLYSRKIFHAIRYLDTSFLCSGLELEDDSQDPQRLSDTEDDPAEVHLATEQQDFFRLLLWLVSTKEQKS